MKMERRAWIKGGAGTFRPLQGAPQRRIAAPRSVCRSTN